MKTDMFEQDLIRYINKLYLEATQTTGDTKAAIMFEIEHLSFELKVYRQRRSN
jgi:hypothetical protein